MEIELKHLKYLINRMMRETPLTSEMEEENLLSRYRGHDLYIKIAALNSAVVDMYNILSKFPELEE